MASFKKRPNGTYQASIFVGRDSNGKQLFEYVTRPTLKECKVAAREIEQEIEDGNYSNMKRVRLIAWVEDWIEINRNELSPSTVLLYKLYLKAHYKPYFKNTTLGQITSMDIEKFKGELLKKLSPNTVRKLLSVLNKILRTALKDKNPARHVELPKKVKYVPRVPTTEEFNKIREVAKKSLFDEVIILLSGWCGLRRGEIFALKPNDIFEEKGILRVDEAYTINDEYDYVYDDPKSDNGFRDVVVPKELMNLITKYIVSQKKIPDKLFNMRPDHYSNRFHKIIVDNELPPIRFHDLRHYHATWLYENGIPDQYAAKRLGHDIQTLKSIYQHLGLNKEVEIDDKIRQLHKEPPAEGLETKSENK